MAKITQKTIKSVHLKSKKPSSPYFIRDSELKGFALRVFPSGTIKYIVEVWILYDHLHRFTTTGGAGHPIAEIFQEFPSDIDQTHFVIDQQDSHEYH